MVVFLDLAWLYRPEPGHLRTGQLCLWASWHNYTYTCLALMRARSTGEFTSLGRCNWAPARVVLPIFALEAPPGLGEGGGHLNVKTIIN